MSLALHWPNPLAWLAARQLRVEREHACDDAVVLAGARPSDYARELIELAESFKPMPIRANAAAAMARQTYLRGRLQSILDEGTPRARGPRGGLAAAGLALGLVLAMAAFTPVAPLPSQAPDLGSRALMITQSESPNPSVDVAQIRGSVTDALTGAPLPDAQVELVGQNNVGVSSATGGYVILNVPAGTHQLRVARVGYELQSRQVALTDDAVLETDFALSPIDVAAEVPSASTSAETEPAGSLPRIVGLSPRPDGSRPQPIILVDGIRIVGAQATALDLVDPSRILRIEIITGPAATTLYGETASDGVIQIFTKPDPSGDPAPADLGDLGG